VRQTVALQQRQTRSIRVLTDESKEVAGRLGADTSDATSGSVLAIPPLHQRKITFELPENVGSWMALSGVLVQKGALKPIPRSVEDLVGLDATALARREASATSANQKFFLRALRNYKRELESLEKEAAALPGGWEPAWDAEKRLVRQSKDRPAPRRWMERDSFREALINKAYVYDVLIRMRGGTTDTYDRFEMAHYLSEMIWCAQKLGHPFGDEIQKMVNGYVEGLQERRALTAK
jgi:hypothetical protein